MRSLDIDVLVERGAGAAAWFPDEAYEQAGATVLDADELRKDADVLVTIGQPDAATIAALRPGQTVIGLLRPLTDPGSPPSWPTPA